MNIPELDGARILCRLRRRVRGWLALALAAALLVALFAYTVNGDPISGAWAQQRAIRYAEQRFPGQTFTAPNHAKTVPIPTAARAKDCFPARPAGRARSRGCAH